VEELEGVGSYLGVVSIERGTAGGGLAAEGAAAGALLRGGGAPATVSRGEWAGELPGNEVKLVRGFARVGMGRRGGLRVS